MSEPLDLDAYCTPSSIECKWDEFAQTRNLRNGVQAIDAIAFARKLCRELQAEYKAQEPYVGE